MTAEIFVVRIVSCTNDLFMQADKRDPAGLYVGNLGPVVGRLGRSWLPMALVAAELCASYQDAVDLELSARLGSEGFTFEIVRLAEPERVADPLDEKIARGMLGAVLGLSPTPSWVEVERKIQETIVLVDLQKRDIQIGTVVIRRLAAAIRSHSDELDGIVRQWRSHQPGGGQHVGTAPNLTPSWIVRFEHWAADLAEHVAGIPL